MMNVAKSFAKFTGHGPGKAGADGRVELQKSMGFSCSPAHFTFQVDQETRIEQGAFHAQESSGG